MFAELVTCSMGCVHNDIVFVHSAHSISNVVQIDRYTVKLRSTTDAVSDVKGLSIQQELYTHYLVIALCEFV